MKTSQGPNNKPRATSVSGQENEHQPNIVRVLGWDPSITLIKNVSM